ncbi:hypothetical protein [Sandarakinorhabdus sp.]|uniref:hypothetical protein n=1 Tax=Sandarakinorhabdus sp. TaxID=1916663 RepID=UPI00286D897E|nr:hypothetical protein [Sandarakinorhabdus sp.]
MTVRVLEHVVRPAALGVRFRDVATGALVGEGLGAVLTSRSNPARTAALAANGQRVWVTSNVPGMAPVPVFAASADGPPDDLPWWSQTKSGQSLTVTDPAGRFLPLRLDLDLPEKGLFQWPHWAALPQPLLAPLTDDDGTGPVVCRDALPLFSAPGRRAPAGCAELRCQLAFQASNVPAAWALLTASHAGRVCGLAQADAHGRAAMFFPWPPPIRPDLAAAPAPAAVTEFRWPLVITAYSTALDPARQPDLGALLAQLDHPRGVFASTIGGLTALPAQTLEFGRPMTLRTRTTPPGPQSLLLMAAA